jgi:hypothetical protein
MSLLTHNITHSLTRSLIIPLTHSLAHSLFRSRARQVLDFLYLSLSFTHTHTHTHTHNGRHISSTRTEIPCCSLFIQGTYTISLYHTLAPARTHSLTHLLLTGWCRIVPRGFKWRSHGELLLLVRTVHYSSASGILRVCSTTPPLHHSTIHTLVHYCYFSCTFGIPCPYLVVLTVYFPVAQS